jgi:hypothetical protein
MPVCACEYFKKESASLAAAVAEDNKPDEETKALSVYKPFVTPL